MTADDKGGTGWFTDLDPSDTAAAARAIADGEADESADWPSIAVESGYVTSEADYYDRLHAATVEAARRETRARERAEDQQLVHAVRALDDSRRTANELAERVAEWAGTRYEDAGTGVEYARTLADSDRPDGSDRGADSTLAGEATIADEHLRTLAERTVALADEADDLERYVERVAPSVAPNLAGMAGPILAARLIAIAGGLADLARMPSSTVQVLGAEDALFAHLRGSAPSPKHGVIYTHEYVRGTRQEQRGSAARALAGKLTIAARVDHYGGDRRHNLDVELDERISQIRTGGQQ